MSHRLPCPGAQLPNREHLCAWAYANGMRPERVISGSAVIAGNYILYRELIQNRKGRRYVTVDGERLQSRKRKARLVVGFHEARNYPRWIDPRKAKR